MPRKALFLVLVVLSTAFILEHAYYGIHAALRFSSNRKEISLNKKIQAYVATMDANLKTKIIRKEIGVIRSFRENEFNLVSASLSHVPENDQNRFSIMRLEGEQKQADKLKSQGIDLLALDRAQKATLALFGSPSFYLKLIRKFYGIILFDEETAAYYFVADKAAIKAYSKE